MQSMWESTCPMTTNPVPLQKFTIRLDHPKRRSRRKLETALSRLEPLIVPPIPSPPVSNKELEEGIRDILNDRREWQNSMKRSRDTYEKTSKLMEHCYRREDEIKDIQNDIIEAEKELETLKRQYHALVPVSTEYCHMTPEQRVLDTQLTLKEDLLMTMSEKFRKDLTDHQKAILHAQDLANLIVKLKREHSKLAANLHGKRARLANHIKKPEFTIESLEECIDRLVSERVQEVERARRLDNEEHEKKYVSHLCPLCSDAITSTALPCCHHGTCTACMDKLITTDNTYVCPFCRKHSPKEMRIQIKL